MRYWTEWIKCLFIYCLN